MSEQKPDRFSIKTNAEEGSFRVSLHIVWKKERPKNTTTVSYLFSDTLPDLELLSVRIDEPGLIPTRLRRFPWSKWTTVAEATARQKLFDQTPRPLGDQDPLLDAVKDALEVPGPKRKRGPVPRGNDFYIAIAKRIGELQADGLGAPTKRLAAELGYNRNTTAGHLRQARLRGFLSPATPGKSS